MLLSWLCFLFSTRTSRAIRGHRLSPRLLPSLALTPFAALGPVGALGAVSTLGARRAFGTIAALGPIGSRIAAPVAIAAFTGFASTLPLLLAGLLSSLVFLRLVLWWGLVCRLLVAGLHLRTVGINCRWLLPALLPISALSLWRIGIGLVSVSVVIVVIQELVNSMRCCARDSFAINRPISADDAIESKLIARLALANLGSAVADQVSLIRIIYVRDALSAAVQQWQRDIGQRARVRRSFTVP